MRQPQLMTSLALLAKALREALAEEVYESVISESLYSNDFVSILVQVRTMSWSATE